MYLVMNWPRQWSLKKMRIYLRGSQLAKTSHKYLAWLTVMDHNLNIKILYLKSQISDLWNISSGNTGPAFVEGRKRLEWNWASALQECISASPLPALSEAAPVIYQSVSMCLMGTFLSCIPAWLLRQEFANPNL